MATNVINLENWRRPLRGRGLYISLNMRGFKNPHKNERCPTCGRRAETVLSFVPPFEGAKEILGCDSCFNEPEGFGTAIVEAMSNPP